MLNETKVDKQLGSVSRALTFLSFAPAIHTHIWAGLDALEVPHKTPWWRSWHFTIKYPLGSFLD